MMNKYKNKVLISLVAVLILALAGCWISKIASTFNGDTMYLN